MKLVKVEGDPMDMVLSLAWCTKELGISKYNQNLYVCRVVVFFFTWQMIIKFGGAKTDQIP